MPMFTTKYRKNVAATPSVSNDAKRSLLFIAEWMQNAMISV
ncbi:hypothetical protein GALL_432610 [mine drainage metagenome]|uniref:Uncharacterized protein n=1 Tax=mine drainage metagenome TaxID=410659 RepID=A0A1J5PUD0_9ZZZZ